MATADETGDVAQDTIFAVSSGSGGPSAVAVVRVSGPSAVQVLERIAPPLPKPRFAAFRKLRHPDTGEEFDHALALWFPGPKSETGEDMCELQVHGGRAVLAATFNALYAIPGCRRATAGEFTRRAFENGKLDLTSVEGLADLIEAETDAQLRQALRQASGALWKLYVGWTDGLVDARAQLEAAIDFSDEPDVEASAAARGMAAAMAVAAEIRAHLDDGHRGEIVRDGFRVVLAGPPNVGKSSLLNALAKRDVAIVSDEPGTTRDVLEVRFDLGGHSAIYTDTAGLRDVASAVEREGIRRARSRAKEADLILWIIDATAPIPEIPTDLAGLGTRTLRVINKIDRIEDGEGIERLGADVAVSAETGKGLGTLVDIVGEIIESAVGRNETPAITQARHRHEIETCLAALDAIPASGAIAPELASEQVRLAINALSRIVGAQDPERVLDLVFARFCIGK